MKAFLTVFFSPTMDVFMLPIVSDSCQQRSVIVLFLVLIFSDFWIIPKVAKSD